MYDILVALLLTYKYLSFSCFLLHFPGKCVYAKIKVRDGSQKNLVAILVEILNCRKQHVENSVYQ